MGGRLKGVGAFWLQKARWGCMMQSVFKGETFMKLMCQKFRIFPVVLLIITLTIQNSDMLISLDNIPSVLKMCSFPRPSLS